MKILKNLKNLFSKGITKKDKDIFLVDKSKGISSFDVIRRLRKKLGVKKMGHAGTLDPLATGLIIVGVGKGTKKLSRLIGLPKVYQAEILLGKQTETGDLEGRIVNEQNISNISREDVRKALGEMEGVLELRVPIYSAIKKKGKPLYKYAREGKTVDVPKKIMQINRTKLIDFDGKVVKVEFDVESGTYIRTLAEELGRRLGTVAVLQNLRRISIGDYNVKNARKV